MMEMFSRTKSWIVLSIILVAAGFLIPAVFGASPNDACFESGCHDAGGSKPIDRSLYESNPHSIIECIDCHENSVVSTDPDHGKFIRQLSGNKISGPLLSSYSSEEFDLCYFCHNESKVVGMAPGFISSDNHVNLNINVSTIGTNFINVDQLGFHNGSPPPGELPDIPTNIHWNHLDAFGSVNYGNGGKFDSNMDGLKESYQSCPACHNVHGTNYPRMTKNDIAITYGNDTNGTFGYISSDEYNRGGGDLYCGGSCHTNGPTFRYYRNEINVFEDCVSCHINGAAADVDGTAFSQGVHININTTGEPGGLNNNDCWTCHYDRDMNRNNIRKCEDCHVTGIYLPEPAPLISTHISGVAVKNYSCTDCHSKVIAKPGAGIVNVTSHYLKKPVIPSTNYCDYCHGPNANELFQAKNKTISEFNHDNSTWDGTATCRTCHSNSGAAADPLAGDSSSFHDLTTELGDVFNGTPTTTADCVICHIQKDERFVIAPSPPISHPDTSGMTPQDCSVCHGDNRHNVAGSCINCHAIKTTRYYVNTSLFAKHKNVNTNDGPDNITDDDCKTCHFNNSMPMDLGAANYNNTYFCQDCHTNGERNQAQYDSMTDEILKKAPMPPGHGQNSCAQCHIPGFDKERPLTDKVRYHTHGPAGFVD